MKYPNYPTLDFVDDEIIDFWKRTYGDDPDRITWDIPTMLSVQILCEIRKLTEAVKRTTQENPIGNPIGNRTGMSNLASFVGNLHQQQPLNPFTPQ